MMKSKTLAAFLLLACAGPAAAATAYPSKPIRFIVPYPPGGNADFIARPLADKLSERWGQQVVIDNRGGAGGLIGENLAAGAPADGYTLVFLAISHAVNPTLVKSMPYDAAKAFDPVVLVNTVPNLLVVYPQLPVHSVADLVRLAKAKPGTLNYGSSGNGTSVHLAAELFKKVAGVDIVRVTYKGSAAAALDLATGRVQLMFDVMTSGLRNAAAGRVRALAVTSAKRSAAAPDIPAIAESVPGYEMTSWQGIAVPAGTPPAIVSKLNAELVRIIALPDVRDRLIKSGAEPVGSTPAAFRKLIDSEIVRWRRILTDAGIQAQ